MVPDKFNMVDMGGIDLIMMQGEAVPGLYDKLMVAISNCHYQCLYHWMFDSVLIPPTYVQMTVVDGEIYLNGGVSVTSDDVIHIYTLSPGPTPPSIIPFLAEENGTYNAPAGVDGFNPVTVDVPSYTPVINPITITENGTYNVSSGVDGFNPVIVNVPSPPLQAKTVSENGIVLPDSGYYGLSSVDVQVSGGGIEGTVSMYTAEGSVNIISGISGSLNILVLALNGEASTKNLNLTATKNGNSITVETLEYHQYTGQAPNTRNYRLGIFSVNLSYNDEVIITCDQAGYTQLMVAVTTFDISSVDLAMTSSDASISSSSSAGNFVFYGYINGSSNTGKGTLVPYTVGATVSTGNVPSNYGAGYIFWLS